MLDHLHNGFHIAFEKFSKHWDVHPAKKIYKIIRVFDPRQAPAMERHIEAYGTLWELRTPASPELSEPHINTVSEMKASQLPWTLLTTGKVQVKDFQALQTLPCPTYTSQSVLLTVRGVSASTRHCSLTRESLLLSSTPSALPSCTSMEMWAKDGKCLRKQHMPACIFKKVL